MVYITQIRNESVISHSNRPSVLTSSERPISKLSENHKINVIGPTELKLWPFKKMLYLMLGIDLLLTRYRILNPPLTS